MQNFDKLDTLLVIRLAYREAMAQKHTVHRVLMKNPDQCAVSQPPYYL